jgi:hypothetical protein
MGGYGSYRSRSEDRERAANLERIEYLKGLDDPESREKLEQLVSNPDRVVSDEARDAVCGPPLPNDSIDPNDVE